MNMFLIIVKNKYGDIVVRYYNLILELPLILIIIFKIYGTIKTKTAIVFWLSFFVSAITYAVFDSGYSAVLSILLSFPISTILLMFFKKLREKKKANKYLICISEPSKSENALFFDGRKSIELSLKHKETVLPGKIYIIGKIN